ncbi:MAG: helix-turn-helix domain-containing protein [Desulfosarcina sp.]|nr:helix-turn-helix domain-containing protein [Desulfosarcina sp.]MBC2742101.1 helix-turn-helix domain-containing protein [Desulfosarcina sp.]MBC2765014.1 helix-turn-helix domain-containing protein [Desulfosarcina sp.]
MAENGKTLTTGEFSLMTGIAVSTITRMLRQGKIRGEKRNGKWAINESELQSKVVVTKKDRGKSSTGLGPIFDTPATAGKAYDVKTFAQMTYLTEKGVRQWLKTGRLSGKTNAGGKVLVYASNLDRPELRHLVRK